MLLAPNTSGYYGDYGGKFIPEILTTTFDELIEAFQEAKADPNFWKEYVNNIIQNGGSHLIVAHSNSLRAIVKILDQLSDKEIMNINIPTGVPLVYTLGEKLNVKNKEYLIDEKILKNKQDMVISQGKIK